MYLIALVLIYIEILNCITLILFSILKVLEYFLRNLKDYHILVLKMSVFKIFE